MRIERPFHAGERAVQERLGETEPGERNGRAIANSVLRGAFEFIERRPFLVAGSVAPDGEVWASFVAGEPGFARVRDERTLDLDLQRAARHPDDPLTRNLERDPRIGLLFIEPAKRRRLRVNGAATGAGGSLRVAVHESYPNCPKYIRRRHLRSAVVDAAAAGPATQGRALGPDERALITAADTFFVASANPSGGVDASHRGGPPGFVRIRDETLWIPDYPGNHMYNTLGNLTVNPRAGLVFVDFESGRTLQLTGRTQIVWEVPGQAEATAGTQRFWTFTVGAWRAFDPPIRLAWEELEASPHEPPAPRPAGRPSPRPH